MTAPEPRKAATSASSAPSALRYPVMMLPKLSTVMYSTASERAGRAAGSAA